MIDPDLTDLVTAWLGGEVPDGRRAAVLARLRSDAEFRSAAVAELRTLAMLNVLRSGEPRWLRLEDELGWSADDAPHDFTEAVATEVASLPLPITEPGPVPASRRRRLQAATALALIATAAVIWYAPWRPPSAPSPGSEDAVGLVVRMDGAGWVDGAGPAAGELLRPGTLVLADGSATLALFNGVTLHVEGPAEVTVWSADRVFFRRGKVRVEAPLDPPRFTAQAPGATVTDPTAEFALTVTDDDLSEVAVFEGQADVAVLDRAGRSVNRETLVGGQTVRLDGRIGQISSAVRAIGAFAGPIPRLGPPLGLDPGYPAAVLADRPAGYWRFETASDGRTPNEVPSGPPMALIGQAAPDGPVDNRGLRLPAPTEWEQHGALATGPWAPAGRDYAVECWVMSRTVRQSALVGLVAGTDAPRLDLFGVLLELTGQPPLYRLPSRTIRALHRMPVGPAGGVNQFAPVQYLPYRWYHLVTQRTGDRLELYVNGTRVAVGASLGPALPPCRVLLGALYATPDGKACFHRPFVGTLDEVAVYGRSLSPVAIRRHYQLGHPHPTAPAGE
ncbi:MAG TPA: LamG-like jellyroll fold domain-containing protein [Gemmata sp.]